MTPRKHAAILATGLLATLTAPLMAGSTHGYTTAANVYTGSASRSGFV